MSELYIRIKNEVLRSPEQAAVIDQFGPYAYQRLIRDAEKLAELLIAEGVAAGAVVSLYAPTDRSFFVGLLAILAAGGVAFPVPEADTLNKAGVDFKDAVFLQLSLSWNSATEEFEPVLLPGQSGIDSRLAGLNAAVIRPTSGTVSASKGVVISHESVLQRIQNANQLYRIEAGETVGWFLPLAHHFVVSVFAFLKYRATILLVPSKCFGNQLVALLEKNQVDFCYAAPLHYHAMSVAAPCWKPRLAISTTYALSATVAAAFYDSFEVYLSQALGIIEVGLALGNIAPTEASMLAVGLPLGNCEAQLTDLDAEGRGVLSLKSSGCFDAYLKPYQEYAEIASDGWFSTGDVASIDNAGIYTIVGRAKSVINVYGMKVFPEEVERVIEGYPGVLEVRVTSKFHEVFNASIIARLVVVDELFTEKGLRKYCREQLETYKVPSEFQVVAKLEKTATGKVIRRGV